MQVESAPRIIRFLDLSMSQDTEAGNFLGKLYYTASGREIINAFSTEERSGFPHDGGAHSLKLYGVSEGSVRAFLELVQEIPIANQYHSSGRAAFIAEVKLRLKKYLAKHA